jgi:alkanesulfonate monooxygenase SsuD/methylene tetrahydromethanopterin reductase-like flavin-dependent oxidoreductase (luciferase family)
MDVGIGLPSTIPGVGRDAVLEWARRAEARGFSSLGTIDRMVYDNFEPLIALAAAAAVTERIRLATTILIAPVRANGALLAKQAASVDRLSDGRLVLGVAVGGREDDYTASGVDFRTRGRRFGQMLEQWRAIWAGDSFGTAGAIGPRPARERPTLMVGGSADIVFERAAAYGDGWMMGGGSPDQFGQGLEKLRRAWAAKGREGSPRTLALGYFALGDGAEQAADGYLRDYYAFLGDYAGAVADSAAKDAATVSQYVDGFAAAGCDELMLFPCDPDPAQVDLLADAIARR